MYQKIKAELQIFFVLLVVTAVLLLWSTSLRPAPQTAEIIQEQDNAPTAPFQNGSLANPTPLVEGITALTVTANYTYYLPSIHRSPTPTPVPYLFFDDFSSSGSGWVTFSNSDCQASYEAGEYRMEVEDDSDGDDECFAFTSADNAEQRYGRFEVRFRRTDGADHYNAGIYINGAGGGEYYLFRIEHDGNTCSWQLIRREDNDPDTEAEGGCSTRTNGGSANNVMLLSHTSDGVLKMYLNGHLLGSFSDGDQLTSRGTGLFINSEVTDDNVVVRFDNFTIYPP